MNKKLFAMMMVPVIVVMGGTFAFSAWSGSANAFFNQNTATVGYIETVNFVGTNAHSNPLTVGGSGIATNSNVTSTTMGFQVAQAQGSAASTISAYANVTNLVPGDYAEFNVTIYNSGTAYLNTSEIEFYSAQGVFYNGAGQQISTPQPIGGLQPPVTPAYLGEAINNTAGIPNGNGPLYIFNASTPGNPGSTPALLAPLHTIEYNVYAILPNDAAPSWQNFHFELQIEIPLSTIQ